MGYHASAQLWYGVREETSEDFRTYVEEPPDNPYGELVVDGFHITRIYTYDRYAGTGAILAYNWIGDKTEVDLSKLDALKAAVDKLFDEWNVQGERKLWLDSDYS